MPSVRLHAFFSGNVQGVGFRYRTCRVAKGHPVAGWVRNLPDGRVELVAEGAREDLERFFDAVRSEMEALVRDCASAWEDASGGFDRFDIAT